MIEMYIVALIPEKGGDIVTKITDDLALIGRMQAGSRYEVVSIEKYLAVPQAVGATQLLREAKAANKADLRRIAADDARRNLANAEREVKHQRTKLSIALRGPRK